MQAGAFESAVADSDNTNDLLKGILAELRSIGGQLRQQDERIAALETTTRARFEDVTLERQPHKSRKEDPLSTPWTPVLAEIRRAGLSRHTVENAIHIYNNDLVGIDELSKEDRFFPEVPVRSVSADEEREWSMLVGNIWRLPEDGRLALRFQKRCLIQPFQNVSRVPSDPIVPLTYLHRLAADEATVPSGREDARFTSLSRSNISVTDYLEGGVWDYDIDDMDPPILGSRSGTQAGPRGPLMCTFGPWRRVISICGLEHRSMPLFRTSGRFQPHHIEQSIEDYEKCRRRPREQRWVEWDSGCIRFHVTFYRIQSSKKGDHVHPWRHGYLHSDLNKRLLCETAYMVLLIPNHDRGNESSRDFWTLLELRPAYFPGLSSSIGGTISSPIDVLHATLVVADKAMIKVHVYWREILNYFDNLVSERDTFLEPDRHDGLLSDDETFSRSKKLFWAITTLKELNLSISDNLLQLRRLLDATAPTTIENLRKAEFEDARSCLEIRYKEIDGVASKLREKRREAVDLRDGLFNASAVIESRAATRLGENVKLLTFVSIFFLPLSFCMSLWSINDMFSLNSLAIVTPLVGIGTYIIVFNINSLVHALHYCHRTLSASIIAAMELDGNETWKRRATAFARFKTRRRAMEKPSDWRLLQYATMRPWGFLRRGQGMAEGDSGDEEKPSFSAQSTGLSYQSKE